MSSSGKRTPIRSSARRKATNEVERIDAITAIEDCADSGGTGKSIDNHLPVAQDGKDAPETKRRKLERMPTAALIALQPSKDTTKAVNIAVASRALFKLDMDFNPEQDSEKMEEYLRKVIANEGTPFPKGAAFPFISALGKVNECLLAIDPKEQERFNVVLMSHNHSDVGVRLINSVNYHNLHIERMCLTGGSTPVPHYLEAYNVSLFLTSYPHEVEKALECGFAAAVMSEQLVKDSPSEQLRIAFDLDAVLFSDESEKQYKAGGLGAFFKHERDHANQPLEEGPLKAFAQSLGRMQQKFNAHKHIVKESPIKIYIVTARSAASSGERAIKTLRAWGVHIDEIHFLAGAPKGPILNAIKPHIFFDDQNVHIESAQKYGISAAQVSAHPTNKSSDKREGFRKRNLSLVVCDDDDLCTKSDS